MMKQGGLKRKSKAASDIPSSSLADMAFLLLIFFMVTTVFRREQPREVTFPEAEATQKMEDARKDVLNVYVEQTGNVYINDVLTPIEQVASVVGPQRASNPQLLVVIRGDIDVPYRFIWGVQEQLQAASAVRVTFYTNVEQRMLRERR